MYILWRQAGKFQVEVRWSCMWSILDIYSGKFIYNAGHQDLIKRCNPDTQPWLSTTRDEFKQGSCTLRPSLPAESAFLILKKMFKLLLHFLNTLEIHVKLRWWTTYMCYKERRSFGRDSLHDDDIKIMGFQDKLLTMSTTATSLHIPLEKRNRNQRNSQQSREK